MAPTICLTELRMPKIASNLYSRRRLRIHNSGIMRQQRLELRQILDASSADVSMPLSPPESPIWEPASPYAPADESVASCPDSPARIPGKPDDHWRMLLARREGLLDIVARTMALIRRNHVLQNRVNALRTETRDFIRSVLSNPENKSKLAQDTASCKETVVSSSTEEICSRPSPPPTPDSSSVSSNCITSCAIPNVENDTVSNCTLDDSEVSRGATQVPQISST